MANIPQLEQQQANKLCRELLDEFNLRNIYMPISYSNKDTTCINIGINIKLDSRVYGFYNSALGFIPNIYIPFIYKKIPVILNN